MLQGVLIDQTFEVLFQLTGEFGRSTRAWAIPQALRPLLRKAWSPLTEGGIRSRERRGDRVDRGPGHDRTDRLRPAKDSRLLGLREQGI